MDSEKQAAKPTRYTVLQEVRETYQDGDEEREQHIYRVISEVSAQGASAARQSAFNSLSDADQRAGVTLIAVPSRSWQPKRRTLVTQPKSVEV